MIDVFVLAQLQQRRTIPGAISPFLAALSAVIFYLFGCYVLMRICRNAGHDPGFLIWIPVLQLIPMFRAAGLHPAWILLLLIPIVNIIVTVVMWVGILQNMGRSGLSVILFIFPLVNLIFLLYLAFSPPPAARPGRP